MGGYRAMGELVGYRLGDEDDLWFEISGEDELLSNVTEKLARMYTFDSVQHEIMTEDGVATEWLVLNGAKPQL